jgi:peptidoglycan/xylan/chitin deacetylase (PgdA/CDA1 family)
VGAHTVTHPLLSSLSVADQRSEIQGAKTQLEAILGRPVDTFSYPYGSPFDYTDATTGLLRSAGFSLACSSSPGLVADDTDPLRVPRHQVLDWTGDEFERKLEEWLA